MCYDPLRFSLSFSDLFSLGFVYDCPPVRRFGDAQVGFFFGLIPWRPSAHLCVALAAESLADLFARILRGGRGGIFFADDLSLIHI